MGLNRSLVDGGALLCQNESDRPIRTLKGCGDDLHTGHRRMRLDFTLDLRRADKKAAQANTSPIRVRLKPAARVPSVPESPVHEPVLRQRFGGCCRSP